MLQTLTNIAEQKLTMKHLRFTATRHMGPLHMSRHKHVRKWIAQLPPHEADYLIAHLPPHEADYQLVDGVTLGFKQVMDV